MVLSINGKRYNCPESWAQVRTSQFKRIIREFACEPDLLKRDYFKLFSILTETEFKGFVNSAEMEATIWNCISWALGGIEEKKPSVIPINGEIYRVPDGVTRLSIGQNILLLQAMQSASYREELISYASAVFMQPVIDGKFNPERIAEIEKIFDDMSVNLVYPLGFFSLSLVVPPGEKPINRWKKMTNSLKRTLKSLLPARPALQDSPLLRSYPLLITTRPVTALTPILFFVTHHLAR